MPFLASNLLKKISMFVFLKSCLNKHVVECLPNSLNGHFVLHIVCTFPVNSFVNCACLLMVTKDRYF